MEATKLENQMEKKMENEMETGIILCILGHALYGACCKRPQGPSRGDAFAQVISELSQHLPVSLQNLGTRARYAQNCGG